MTYCDIMMLTLIKVKFLGGGAREFGGEASPLPPPPPPPPQLDETLYILDFIVDSVFSLSVLSGFPPPPIPGFRPPGLPGDPLGGAAALGMLGQHPPIPPPGLPGLPPNLPGLGNPLARPTVVSTIKPKNLAGN